MGKTIRHVAIAEGSGPPSQLFLIFSDGTYYEFYAGTQIDGAAGIDHGGLEDIRRFTTGQQQIVFEV